MIKPRTGGSTGLPITNYWPKKMLVDIQLWIHQQNASSHLSIWDANSANQILVKTMVPGVEEVFV